MINGRPLNVWALRRLNLDMQSWLRCLESNIWTQLWLRDRRTDGCCQVNYLPASLCYANYATHSIIITQTASKSLWTFIVHSLAEFGSSSARGYKILKWFWNCSCSPVAQCHLQHDLYGKVGNNCKRISDSAVHHDIPLGMVATITISSLIKYASYGFISVG